MTSQVRIQFDPNQPHQRAAIDAVTQLFVGQPYVAQSSLRLDVELPDDMLVDAGVVVTNPNVLALAPQQIACNLAQVQQLNNIPQHMRSPQLDSMDFTVEMETGTGKTYCEVATMLELHRRYGWSKFVVVTPNVAIREGMVANLRLLADHFRTVYSDAVYLYHLYDSDFPGSLRDWACSSGLQILVINVDAFNKETNLIHQGRDQTFGVAPIDMVRACRPIVIMDEPQDMESEIAKAAIERFNPLMRLRYSATHRNHYHPVYRLSPSQAYDMGLVKRIDVWSVLEDPDLNRPYIRLLGVETRNRIPEAKLELEVKTTKGVKRQSKWTTSHPLAKANLVQVTDCSVYEGWVLEEVHSDGWVQFTNGQRLSVGDQIGIDPGLIQQAMIRTCVRQHLDRELELLLAQRSGLIAPIKVLSLIFIDRVANYNHVDAPFRCWLEQEYRQLAQRTEYAELDLPEVHLVHGGYFSGDPKGALGHLGATEGGYEEAKDTNGKTKADRTTYDLIMRDKQRLLSPQEPLRFIFSHSALAKGWDNPNVFQICTLAEQHSEISKRQKIGRGLRLPVQANGQRCVDRNIARLVVIANESFADFARDIQKEVADDSWLTPPSGASARYGSSGEQGDQPLIHNARARREIEVNEQILASSAMQQLWERISPQTSLEADYDSERLIQLAAEHLGRRDSLDEVAIRAELSSLDAIDGGAQAGTVVSERIVDISHIRYPIPDIMTLVCKRIPWVTRSTVAGVVTTWAKQDGLNGQHQLLDISINPQQFVARVCESIEAAHNEVLQQADNSRYVLTGERLNISHIREHPWIFYMKDGVDSNDRVVETPNRSVYRQVPFDSTLERSIAEALDRNDDVLAFLKLPPRYKIDTPAGGYNPDWAIAVQDVKGGSNVMFLVRESKPSEDKSILRGAEWDKIQFGRKHYATLGVDYRVVDDPQHIIQ